MPDVYDAETRSRVMRAVKGKNTSPEKTTRSLLHTLGYRFRLHRRDLPGVPDIVFPTRKAVVCVHGCFWHGHGCRRGRREPKTNVEYWRNKRTANMVRDELAERKLAEQGWRTLVVWECELKDKRALEERLKAFLGPPGPVFRVLPTPSPRSTS